MNHPSCPANKKTNKNVNNIHENLYLDTLWYKVFDKKYLNIAILCVVNYLYSIMNLQKKAIIICRKKLKLFFKVNKFERTRLVNF